MAIEKNFRVTFFSKWLNESGGQRNQAKFSPKSLTVGTSGYILLGALEYPDRIADESENQLHCPARLVICSSSSVS